VKAAKSNSKVNLGTFFSGKGSLFLNSIIAILSLAIIILAYTLIASVLPAKKVDKPTTGVDSVHTLQLEVLNGCGKAGVGDIFVDFLRKNKMDVVQTGNYVSFDMPNTLIINRSGRGERARYIAQLLGVDTANIIRQYNKNYYVDVSVIIGKDYKSLLQKK
jgi:hypothetical protein